MNSQFWDGSGYGSNGYGGGGGGGGYYVSPTYVAGTGLSLPPTVNAVLTPFTNQQIIDSFSKIDFSAMPINLISGSMPVLKLNSTGATAIALYENLSLSFYDKDGSVSGNATIGFGHVLHSGEIKSTDVKNIKLDQSILYFAQDIITAENTLNQKIENRGQTGSFTRDQYFALADMMFNGGDIVDSIINAMRDGGISAATTAINYSYVNALNEGQMIRRYFDAQAFTTGRILTPEQSRTELVNLGLIP